jgi:GxxExxY protein
MEVHKRLGNGFQEVIYQRALAIEMKQAQLLFERELEMDIYYRDIEIGSRRVDFYVDYKVMVELKAVIKLDDVHLAQAMNYLEAYGLEIGLLINFGGRSLDFKRVHNNKKIRNESQNQATPNQATPNQANPNQANPNQANSNQGNSNQGNPNQGNP